MTPGVTQMVRWQSHWHVVRQSWPFFQNDFAGRIANRVMQTGYAVRETVTSAIRSVWYIFAFGGVSLGIMAVADWRLAVPTLVWWVAYLSFLRWFVPRMRDRARRSAEGNSALIGRIVDSYANILTVKLFARATDEDAYVAKAIDEHRRRVADHMRLTTGFMVTLATMNAPAGGRRTAATGIGLWATGRGRRRRRRDGAAARLADLQHGRLGLVGDRRHLRERRHGAGRHADDRGPAPAGRPRRCRQARGHPRRGRVRRRSRSRYPNSQAPVLEDF